MRYLSWPSGIAKSEYGTWTTTLEDRAHAGLLARCVAQCELILPGRARRKSLGAEDGARVALVDL